MKDVRTFLEEYFPHIQFKTMAMLQFLKSVDCYYQFNMYLQHQYKYHYDEDLFIK